MVATGRTFKVGPLVRVVLNNSTFVEVRKTARLESILRVRGETWVSRLNAELAKAQTARKQKVEDGYTFYIHDGGTRLRMYVVAMTARAQAHERKHSSILKLMETTKHDVKTRAALEKTQIRKAAAAKAAETRRKNRIMSEFERNASGQLMVQPIPVWVAPSARDLTRTYMMEQLAARTPSVTAPWSSTVPAVRPAKFFTLEELNSATEYGVFADAQLIQIRGYSSDMKWLTSTMRLIKGLWKVMPAALFDVGGGRLELAIQSTEHAGGPLYDEDPDVPGLRYGQLITWVTVMTELM